LLPLVEKCFFAGSAWVIRLLGSLREGGTPDLDACALSWLSVRQFYQDHVAERQFFSAMAASFASRYEKHREHRISLDKRYRALKVELVDRLALTALGAETEKKVTAGWLASIRELSAATTDWPQVRRRTLLADILHMQVNRIFRSSQLRYEGAIYYYLNKYAGGMEKRNPVSQ
jgi:hypothetical protein